MHIKSNQGGSGGYGAVLAAKSVFLLLIVWTIEAASPLAAENWQQKWDKLVTDAKKEGKVVVFSSSGAEIRGALSKAFTTKYGVNLEFISGRPTELVPKLLAERRAGLFLEDIFLAGNGTLVPALGPEGAIKPLDSALILPEVLDKKAWWGNDLLWTDPGHLQVMFLAYPQTPITINGEILKIGEITSYRDLLNPKWKDKITFNDPTITGSGNTLFTALADSLMDLEYLKALGRQGLVLIRNSQQQGEWVARGKYPIGVGIQTSVQTALEKAGVPLKNVTPVEGTIAFGGGGGLVLLNNEAHPNAAKLFINWLLSREGGLVASKAYGGQSARLDVPSDFLKPDRVRQPGVKYISEINPQFIAKKEKYMKISRELWEHLLK